MPDLTEIIEQENATHQEWPSQARCRITQLLTRLIAAEAVCEAVQYLITIERADVKQLEDIVGGRKQLADAIDTWEAAR